MTAGWDADSVGSLLRALGLDGVEAVHSELIADFEQRSSAAESLERFLTSGVAPCNVFDASWE
ncbi:MAG TPA: hypothetical protein DCR10_02870 [Acidimicrobiaceae bacterium]|nr:hypothetical protein [Acidimicrobiaceae bacterium]